MEFTVPTDRRYAESHEWVTTQPETVRVGISDFAQDELGDIVFVDLPTEGDELDEDEELGVVESIKAISDVYTPVAGTIVDVNDAVIDRPELVNEAPYDDGWLVELQPEDDLDHLLDASEYRETL